MLDTIHDKYANLRDDLGERTGLTRPDGRNTGISTTESAIAFAAAIGATFIARELLEATWRTTLQRDPPKNPASSEVVWREAILWGAASGCLSVSLGSHPDD